MPSVDVSLFVVVFQCFNLKPNLYLHLDSDNRIRHFAVVKEKPSWNLLSRSGFTEWFFFCSWYITSCDLQNILEYIYRKFFVGHSRNRCWRSLSINLILSILWWSGNLQGGCQEEYHRPFLSLKNTRDNTFVFLFSITVLKT